MRSETVATGLIPAERILPLFDPVLNNVASIIYLDHFPGRQLGIGHNEPYPREEFSVVPLNLGDHPTFTLPGLRLAPQIHQPCLNAALRRSSPTERLRYGSMSLFSTALAGSLMKYVTRSPSQYS